jgi:integrase/recombinase XerD
MGELRERMEMAMRLRNFSSKTITCYIWQVKSFTRMFGRSPAEMGKQEVQQYVESLVRKNKSWSSVRLAYSALRFLYRETLGRAWDVAGLPPAKREKRLPLVMSMEEVQQILQAVRNVKHRTVLMTIYSCGLRVSEAVHLKVTDIDSKRMVVRVEQGKGRKDRYTILSRALLDQLRIYWRMWRPQEWLFPGSTFGTPLSARTIQKIFAVAKKKPRSQSRSLFTPCVIVLQPTS